MDIFDVIRSNDFLLLDTETTGLHSDSEICQIAIINAQGEVLLDTLVKPVNGIPAEATAIHGITNEMVKDAKPFPVRELFDLLDERNVIVYNMIYDKSMLFSSERAIGSPLSVNWSNTANWYCAMETFARIYGDWNAKYKSYKWKTLSTACAYYGIPVTKAHGALEDCLSTLALCKAMVAEKVSSSYDTL